ncbi:MAG: hypothetical protein WC732_05895 [Candidatus Omnitrophota bacterium]
MKKKTFAWSLVVLFFCAGCSQPLRTLMELGGEQKAQQAYVRQKQARFEALLRDIERQRLLPGLRKERVVARYGEPVLTEGGVFLYRDPVDFVGAKKVYLEFNDRDLLDSIKVTGHES